MWFKPKYNKLTFAQVYPNLDLFMADYESNIAIYFYKKPAPLTSASAKTVYFLLYAKYGNNPISNEDINEFKFKIFANIFASGGLWEKKIDIQFRLQELAESEIMTGAKQIYNHALNPSTEPSTDALQELPYINDQNTSQHKKSILEAYSLLWEALHGNATEEFLGKFKNCFAIYVGKDECVPFYIEDEDIFVDNGNEG